mgnify:FL=1
MAFVCVFISGCASPWAGSSAGGSSLAASAKGAASSGYDLVLSFVAAACLLAGVAALVVTRGKLGTRAVVVGLGLVVLNYVLASWGAWLFIPVLVATGAVSLAYAYVIVRRLLKMRKA